MAATQVPRLFSPIAIRSVLVKNRIWVSPMCQYSCAERDGVPTDWHLAHLGQRAVGGAGLVCVEATAVSPEGRISPQDTGLWNSEQVAAWSRITAFIERQGSVPAVQLAHAGRKASTAAPWLGGAVLPPGGEGGGWEPVAPSALAFSSAPDAARPRALTAAELDAVEAAFVAATRNAAAAGFKVVELHAAHGYLLHEFLSPLSNAREDEFGGPFENRVRFPVRVVRAVRAAWPAELPLFVRISATDWAEGGWSVTESVKLARLLREAGVDLIDTSSGGLTPAQKIPLGPGYQVHLSEQIRRECSGMLTGAVGLITTAEQAEAVLSEGRADVVFMARELLREPYFPLKAAKALGVEVADYPPQYQRGRV
jgi:2,4-dienoyl-CoA reductase-like NADH-dependent reductase (Old Yellow Enzyme family)